jgi:biopolymer transport protein ExbD
MSDGKALSDGATASLRRYVKSLRSAPCHDGRVIDLQIDFDGTQLWNKTAVDRATMRGYIASDALKSPQPEVHITMDKFPNYQIVAQTLADNVAR